ncbi:hypothetical protein CVT25_013246 [Psilocybe cyanescens]|uniref:RNA exonuclease 4 n=1 Tax=Psilocybe cyanescens TaxID=93625 RepID=A0A409X0U2_PSICY|nr:hypothetical protein CVT25_013246 [Psilocybe cyanescens]
MSSSKGKGKGVASSNWLSLQKQLKKIEKNGPEVTHKTASRKRQKLDDASPNNKFSKLYISSNEPEPSTSSSQIQIPVAPATSGGKNNESAAALQQMILGHTEYTDSQKLPGKYLALDCEMVGVGIDGVESSLARVSMVNFYGAVIMDEFVRQKERVVDYRTQWSGIRESDMVHAKPFEEVQKKVADLLQDRILVAHAVHNDLKALLLSHPRPQTRDTQFYAHKFGLCKTKRVALRNLVKQEVGITIQSGEHSSITDARATMAVYRLHKKEWEKGSRPQPAVVQAASKAISSKRRAPSRSGSDDDEDDDNDDDEVESRNKPSPAKFISKSNVTSKVYPGGGRKGVSSGLSTVVRHANDKSKTGGGDSASVKSQWWKQLPGGVSAGSGSKGLISKGPMDILKQTLRNEGFFALYKGMASPLLGIAGVNSLLFASYGISKRIISPFPQLSLKEIALAGSMAGAANAILASPVEMFKVRMQGQYGAATDKRLSAVVTVAREIPAYAGFYTAFEFSKRQFSQKYGAELPVWALLASGSTGGIAYWLACYPLDVVKSRIQLRATPPSGTPVQYIAHEIKTIIQESGITGLFRGLSPSLLRSIPAAASTFAAFELTREYLEKATGV